MPESLLTIYLPTFNRANRLKANLNLLFDQISMGKMAGEVSILVGDNSSEDDTHQVCIEASENAHDLGINFSFFQNAKNIGFSGNIAAGYQKMSQGWLLFLSDDDEVFPGAIAMVLRDMITLIPDLAIYNFHQEPHTILNPLVSQSSLYTLDSDYSPLKSLLQWPKLSGMVIRLDNHHALPNNFLDITLNSKLFAHVILFLIHVRDGKLLYKSEEFFAKPDSDYLENVNFVPYIGEILIKELSVFQELIPSPPLKHLMDDLPKTKILESSISTLFWSYQGKSRVHPVIAKVLWVNIKRFLLSKGSSVENLPLGKLSLKGWVKLIFLLFLAMVRICTNFIKKIS